MSEPTRFFSRNTSLVPQSDGSHAVAEVCDLEHVPIH